MEVDKKRVVDEESGDDVDNVKDVELLEQLHLGNESDDNIPPSKHGHGSDDETYNPTNPDSNY